MTLAAETSTPTLPVVVEVLGSFERMLAAAADEHKPGIFQRASVELMRLGTDAVTRSVVADYLHEMASNHGLDVDHEQKMMADATKAPPDKRPGSGPRLQPIEPRAYEPPAVDDAPMPDAYPEGADGERDFAQAQTPAPLTLVCPPAWRDVPLEPMRWLATNRIPAGDVTILSGDGGGGKTTVALQLAVAVERGLGDWLGTVCEQGPVIFFSGEEPEAEMRRRLHRVARKRGLDATDMDNLHFHFASPEACLLGVSRRDGTIAPTPLFDALAGAALDLRPVLIVVDSIAATFGGNQNDRVSARTFVALFRRLAQQADCAILLLDHPSLSGITSGTGRGGSMDWQNATRARLHLETVEGDDGSTGRVLEVKKTNYGPCGEKVTLQWEDGCFVLEAAASAPHQSAANTTGEQRYLECLDAVTTQGRHVCHAPGRGYAPKTFADMPQAAGMTWKTFQAAQERLFAAGVIENVAYGPPSKGTKRIARKV
jgi:RecA-family ATPase